MFVSLSNLTFGTKIKAKKGKKKKDDGVPVASSDRGGARQGGLGLGASVSFDTSLKKKAEGMSFNDFVNGGENNDNDPLNIAKVENTGEDLFAEEEESICRVSGRKREAFTIVCKQAWESVMAVNIRDKSESITWGRGNIGKPTVLVILRSWKYSE